MKRFYYGGPVEDPYTYYWLIPLEKMPDGFQIVSPDQLQRELPEQYNKIVSDPEIAKTVHVLKGYAGWGTMQLNREIYYGAWDTVDFDPAFIFTKNPEGVWDKATKRILGKKRLSDERL